MTALPENPQFSYVFFSIGRSTKQTEHHEIPAFQHRKIRLQVVAELQGGHRTFNLHGADLEGRHIPIAYD